MLISSAILGLIWRRFRLHKLDQMGYFEFYLFGFVVHAILLQWLFLLPYEQALQAISVGSLPIVGGVTFIDHGDWSFTWPNSISWTRYTSQTSRRLSF
jgi:hypothetical protein